VAAETVTKKSARTDKRAHKVRRDAADGFIVSLPLVSF
jgi:hypothetical protein